MCGKAAFALYTKARHKRPCPSLTPCTSHTAAWQASWSKVSRTRSAEVHTFPESSNRTWRPYGKSHFGLNLYESINQIGTNKQLKMNSNKRNICRIYMLNEFWIGFMFTARSKEYPKFKYTRQREISKEIDPLSNLCERETRLLHKTNTRYIKACFRSFTKVK